MINFREWGRRRWIQCTAWGPSEIAAKCWIFVSVSMRIPCGRLIDSTIPKCVHTFDDELIYMIFIVRSCPVLTQHRNNMCFIFKNDAFNFKLHYFPRHTQTQMFRFINQAMRWRAQRYFLRHQNINRALLALFCWETSEGSSDCKHRMYRFYLNKLNKRNFV